MKALDEAVEAVVRTLAFDEAEIARRKAFLEFTAEDVARLRALHATLQTLAPDFANAFYDHLLAFEETRRFIPDAVSVERLKLAQAVYFDSLTAGDYGPEYIANRLRVGVVHQRIGLEPKWYLGAYGKYLGELLLELWQRLGQDPEAFINAYRALIKVVLLDMGLAIDTYIQADRQTILALREYAEMVFASIPDGLLVLSPEFAILSANRAFLKQFGLTAEAVHGRHLMEVIAAEGLRKRALEVLATGIAQHDVLFSMGAARSDARKPMRVTLTGIHLAEEEEEEEEARLLVIVEDMTEEEALRAAALESEHRFQDLVQGLDAIVWEGEANGEELRFTFVSRRAETILGFPVERWLAEPDFWKDRAHPNDRDAVSGFCRRILEHDGGSGEGAAWEVEFRMQAADGRMVWFHNLARRAADSREARLHGVMMDITARKDMAADLEHLASHDALTGLPNRALLFDRLGQALTRAARHRRGAAVLFLDLDRFKLVNDSFGHSMGDQLLKAVAQRLSSCMRAGDTLARLGGDEFAIVLEDMAHAQDAALIVQKI
uniref:protoglobin domain-containing protein n=1 Tax=Halomonas sp. TaxID=1486246 RepID=UPI003566D984